ncbi:Crp/Fnr family transcriptional regulator [Telmatospirillum sp.]|uniref:Crp/Fnr family transcriptional regulator n=1 Tax=Telmatospirillum sp. TaxID=2079197 RepID=UPI00284DD28A|nr:Crp/Fnr family transcriptional regulator [Telmatospirillum sp.]MDR3436876.1 Crp/Fnr family transcriptional regulator [Telmatospirillum sp.]
MTEFPPLAGLDGEAARMLSAGARLVTMPAGTVLFREGQLCDSFLLLLRGRVRIQKVGQNGREIVLYRVMSGESCILTTSCLMAAEAYSAEGVAEADIRAAMVPDALFQALLGRSMEFRRFVFGACGRRLADLLCLVQQVAFGRIDARLAELLLERPALHGVVTATHQTLAVELGTAREVVSRQLKEFERRGWVRLERGSIVLLQVDALAAVGGSVPPL